MGNFGKDIFNSAPMKHAERAMEHFSKVEPEQLSNFFQSLSGFPSKIGNFFTNLNSESKRRSKNLKEQTRVEKEIASGIHDEETLQKLKDELAELKGVHADLKFEDAMLHPEDFKNTIKDDL